MELSKFKTELSKVSGVNFHSPRYREIFKRYFGGENTSEDDDTAESDQSDTPEASGDNAESGAENQSQEQSTDNGNGQDDNDNTDTADNADDSGDNDGNDEGETDSGENNPAADDEGSTDDSGGDSGNQDNSEPDGSTNDTDAEQAALERVQGDSDGDSESDLDGSQSEDDDGEVLTEDESAAQQGAGDVGEQLLNTRLELELVRAGIRDDRLETAKRLFMPEFKSSGGNVQQIKELIAQYPEWLGGKGGARGFGMPLGDKPDTLTNEEKALKRIGINPRE